MPSNRRGKKVELGIWQERDAPPNKGPYIAEVNHVDPQTKKRTRMTKTFHRLDLAREWRAATRTDAMRGEITRKSEEKRILFKDFADEYLATWKEGRKASTVLTENNRIEHTFKPYFGTRLVRSITRKDIETFLRKRREGNLDEKVLHRVWKSRPQGVAMATTNRDLCRLKNMFKYAVNWRYIKENPAIGIKQAREKIEEAEYLSEGEARKFLAAIDPAYRPIFVTAIYTGLRYGEIIGLQWRDVNWNFNRLAIRDPKNNEDRYVPMNKALRETLLTVIPKGMKEEDLDKSEQMIFTNPGTGKLYESVRTKMKQALKAAGITRHIRFHDLRHTTGSHLAMKGATEREIAEVLGHKDTKVTRRYSHLTPSHVQGLVDRLDFEAEQTEEKKEAEGQK